MKGTNVIVLLICFCTSYLTSQAQWVQVFPTPYRYVNIDFFDQDNGFLVSLEEVLKSTDGGDTWQSVIIPGAQVHYSDIFMISKDVIWNVSGGYYKSPGNGVLCKSEDGGDSWSIKLQDVEPDFYKLHFFNEDLGWLGVYENYFYQTVDGGETWTFSEELPTDIVWNFCFINKDTGWVCGGGSSFYIAKTTDGGFSWETQLDDTIYSYSLITDLEFVNDQKGFASAAARTFLATTDGGETWEYIATEQEEGVLKGLPPDYRINDIEFIDENLGWITGGPC